MHVLSPTSSSVPVIVPAPFRVASCCSCLAVSLGLTLTVVR